jgi:hypothetical protein
MTGNRQAIGEVAVLTQGDMSFCAMGCGSGSTGLQTLVWSRIRGQNNMITVSCFIDHVKTGWEQSVHAQHQCHLNNVNDDGR